MKFVFLMDPLESVKFEKDTSFILMIGAARRGHEVYFLPENGISLADGQVLLRVTRVQPRLSLSAPFEIRGEQQLSGSEVDVLFIRTDPPFDARYLEATWLLDHLPAKTAVINDPAGVRTVNEKIWAARFPALLPPTLISGDRERLKAFVRRQRDVVVKPTDGHGGRAVFRVRRGDANTNVVLETLTENFTRPAVAQKYVAAARRGDKRVLLLNGEPLGAVLRVHSADDHRNNFFSGGHPRPAAITAGDRRVIRALKPHLRRLGLYFVGIDLLGESLTEVNVTSPTCLQEMNRLYGARLEDKVIRFAETLARKFKKKNGARTCTAT